MVGAPLSTSSGIQGKRLEITVVGCNNLDEKEWNSKQEPYVCLEYGTTKFRTKTASSDGSRNLFFQEKVLFRLVEGLGDLHVMLWNSYTLSTDELVCSARIQLHKAISQGFDDSAWPLYTNSGRYAGEIRLVLHCSNAAAAAQSNTRYAPPAQAYATPNATLSTVVPNTTTFSSTLPFPSASPYTTTYPPNTTTPLASPYTTTYPPNATTPSTSAFLQPVPYPPNPSTLSTYPPNSMTPLASQPVPYPPNPATPNPYPPNTAYPPHTTYPPNPSPYTAAYPPNSMPSSSPYQSYPPTSQPPPVSFPQGSPPPFQAYPPQGPGCHPQGPSIGVYPPPPSATFNVYSSSGPSTGVYPPPPSATCNVYTSSGPSIGVYPPPPY